MKTIKRKFKGGALNGQTKVCDLRIQKIQHMLDEPMVKMAKLAEGGVLVTHDPHYHMYVLEKGVFQLSLGLSKTEWGINEYHALKHKYAQAVHCKTESFMFQGIELGTDYAKYLLEFFKNMLDEAKCKDKS